MPPDLLLIAFVAAFSWMSRTYLTRPLMRAARLAVERH